MEQRDFLTRGDVVISQKQRLFGRLSKFVRALVPTQFDASNFQSFPLDGSSSIDDNRC